MNARVIALQGSAERILAERIAVKIGMIIRSAAPVVAGPTMRGAQRHGEAGIGQRRGCQAAPKNIHRVPTANSPLRVASPGEILLRPARSYGSRRRLSRIPSRKAVGAPAEICLALSLQVPWPVFMQGIFQLMIRRAFGYTSVEFW